MYVVSIHHECREGWHFFTSPELSGLYIVHRDFELAFSDVPTAARVLIELDWGISVNCEWAENYRKQRNEYHLLIQQRLGNE